MTLYCIIETLKMTVIGYQKALGPMQAVAAFAQERDYSKTAIHAEVA